MLRRYGVTALRFMGGLLTSPPSSLPPSPPPKALLPDGPDIIACPRASPSCLRTYAKYLTRLREGGRLTDGGNVFNDVTLAGALRIASALVTRNAAARARGVTSHENETALLLKSIVWISYKFVQGDDEGTTLKNYARTLLGIDKSATVATELAVLRELDYGLHSAHRDRTFASVVAVGELPDGEEDGYRFPSLSALRVRHATPEYDWSD